MLIYQVIEKSNNDPRQTLTIGYFTREKAAETAVGYYTKQNLKFGRTYFIQTIRAHDSVYEFTRDKALSKLTDLEKEVLGV